MTRTWHDYPKTEVLVGANRISITVTDGTHVHVQSFVEGESASRFSLNGKLHYVSAHFYLQPNRSRNSSTFLGHTNTFSGAGAGSGEIRD